MFEPGGDTDTLRAGVREWCAEHVPPNWREDLTDANHEQISTFLRWWAGELREAGLIAPHWPKEWGGGFSIPEQVVIAEEFARGGVPRNGIYHVAVFNVAPTLLHSATAEQKERFIGGIKKGEAWCQGFSEPNAGSDLASLRTKAVLDGDNYVINGQKVWTSWAAYADWCMLLVRTDPDAPKHKGITWVICDMRSPGIEIREIRTMSHVTDFCEVFYDEVRIPLTNVVGGLNNGWRTAMSTLSFERGTAFMADQVDMASTVEKLIDEARTRTGPDGKRPAIADEDIAGRLATARAEIAALRAMTIAGISRNARTGVPGPEASMIRLFHGEVHQRVYQLGLEIIGDDFYRLTQVDGERTWTGSYLQSFAYTIGGGTTDIQRNIVGERVLGLPRA